MRVQGEFFVVNTSTAVGKNNIDIIVSTKVSKKAVARNRLRRQVREILRSYKKANYLDGLNLKIFILVRCLDAKFADMKKDLERILDKIK